MALYKWCSRQFRNKSIFWKLENTLNAPRGFLAYIPSLFCKEKKKSNQVTTDLCSLCFHFLKVGAAGFILSCSHYREDPKGLTRKLLMARQDGQEHQRWAVVRFSSNTCSKLWGREYSLNSLRICGVAQIYSVVPEQCIILTSACTSAGGAQVMTGLDSAA